MTGRRDSTDTQLFEEDEEKNVEDDNRQPIGNTKEAEVLKLLEDAVNSSGKARRIVPKETLAVNKDWVVIGGMVFDLGSFMRKEAKHPGGRRILEKQLEEGQIATERFTLWHHPSGNAVKQAPAFYVGDYEKLKNIKAAAPSLPKQKVGFSSVAPMVVECSDQESDGVEKGKRKKRKKRKKKKKKKKKEVNVPQKENKENPDRSSSAEQNASCCCVA
eukprot:TRINITY_DN2228_c3_g1_i1.p1 TRINITY_DN2228_c3_g1~~TRINITY_DN2228_c3_g1_i1.p1  ORF type:complete len:217 (+),score=73.89 TRINITY_DN2228_c3_g1_i1:80-730(+)